MEVVKQERVKQTRFEYRNRVSIPGEYFDDMNVELYVQLTLH